MQFIFLLPSQSFLEFRFFFFFSFGWGFWWFLAFGLVFFWGGGSGGFFGFVCMWIFGFLLVLFVKSMAVLT